MTSKVKIVGTLTQVRDDDAGYDLMATESVYLAGRNTRKLIGTGVKIQMPKDMCALVVPRSGLAKNHGIVSVIGLIDPGYRGEVGVNLMNQSYEGFQVTKGMRIAQLLFVPIIRPEFEQVKALDESDRGEKGFGSSGV